MTLNTMQRKIVRRLHFLNDVEMKRTLNPISQ